MIMIYCIIMLMASLGLIIMDVICFLFSMLAVLPRPVDATLEDLLIEVKARKPSAFSRGVPIQASQGHTGH